MGLPTKCRLCDAGSEKLSVVTPHVYGGNPNQSFFGCGNCEAIFLYPPLGEEAEKSFYAAEFESFMQSRSGVSGGWDQAERHISVNEDNRLRRMNYVQPVLKNVKTILEVGCSSGFMLHPLLKQGYKCVGVEPSGVFSDYLTEIGVRCYRDVSEITGSEKFDLIMHFFVLEHVSDPVLFLKSQLSLLNPGGLLVFEIPNANDPLRTIYDIPEFERFYWSVAHHWYFTENSLKFVLDQLDCEYEIGLDQRYDISNHVVWARDRKPGGMGRFSDKLGKGLEENYKSKLIESGFCDTLYAIVRKQ